MDSNQRQPVNQFTAIFDFKDFSFYQLACTKSKIIDHSNTLEHYLWKHELQVTSVNMSDFM